MTVDLSRQERAFLSLLQRLACQYFLDNQRPEGLFLDRQVNFGAARDDGWRSTAAGGMGLVAIALASAEPLRLINRHEAITRVERALTTALQVLPHRHGILPHFTDGHGNPLGTDVCSTVDTAWFVAGSLCAAELLGDPPLQEAARRLSERVNWARWTVPPGSRQAGLIRHGSDKARRFLPYAWDRLNGETVFMYVLAAGVQPETAWPAHFWSSLKRFTGTVAGLSFVSADLGLFVFQYGLDLLNLREWIDPAGIDLHQQARWATEANFRYCRAAAERFKTYRQYWGLSAGDGPPDDTGPDVYRCYAPAAPMDGTAHLMASLASVAHRPDLVLDNLLRARQDRVRCFGRYGFSNINIGRGWAARDMVGIDAGAAFLALDNYLSGDRIRNLFHSLLTVQRGLHHIGFRRRCAVRAA